MKRRLRKKLHKWYLGLYIIDLSYVGNSALTHHWRTRLFCSDFFEPLRIDKHTLGNSKETGLSPSGVRAVQRHNLVYQVTKLPYSEDGLPENSYVTFRFQAVEFPEISTDTYNNLDA